MFIITAKYLISVLTMSSTMRNAVHLFLLTEGYLSTSAWLKWALIKYFLLNDTISIRIFALYSRNHIWVFSYIVWNIKVAIKAKSDCKITFFNNICNCIQQDPVSKYIGCFVLCFISLMAFSRTWIWDK